MDDDDDQVEPETRAQLERWFGLPSFEQVAEEEAKRPPADADLIARRDAQARATAAVDPVLNERLHARSSAGDRMIRFREVDLGVLDPSISAIDPVLLARAERADPRIADLPMGLQEALSECTPQAMLRDLHRPELEFQLRLEVDPSLSAVNRVDHVALVREAMERRAVLDMPEPPLRITAIAMEPLNRAKREPWAEIRTPTRKVTE